jgi:hypothetical protein
VHVKNVLAALIATLMLGSASGQIFLSGGSGPGFLRGYGSDGTPGFINYSLTEPHGLAVDDDGHIFVITRRHGPPDDYLIGEFTTSGQVVNSSLISGLSFPYGITLDGSGNMYIADMYGTVGKYTTSGATVNSSLITGLGGFSLSLANDNAGHLFIVNSSPTNGPSSICEYTTSGTLLNPALISSAANARSIALDGMGHIFVAYSGGFISEYSTSGETINASLITGVDDLIEGLACDGDGHLFVLNRLGVVGEYSTDGQTINPELIPFRPFNGDTFIGLAVMQVPEPSLFAIASLGASLFVLFRSRRLKSRN